MHERCNEFNVFLTRNAEIEKVKRTHSFDRKCRGKKDRGNQKGNGRIALRGDRTHNLVIDLVGVKSHTLYRLS